MTTSRSLVTRRRYIETVPPPGPGAVRRHAVVPVALRWSALRSLGVYCVDTSHPALALTFDDGPHPHHTPRILDVLADHGARATFFVLTPAARAHPAVVRRIVDEGHELALHGRDHASLLTLSAPDAVASVSEARNALEEQTGARITLYRPPYGHHTWQQGRAIAAMGLTVVQWSGDAKDWVDAPAATVAERLQAAAFPGAILLMHDDRADPETLRADEALPAFDKAEVVDRALTGFAQRGLASVTVSELCRLGTPVRSTSNDGMSRR